MLGVKGYRIVPSRKFCILNLVPIFFRLLLHIKHGMMAESQSLTSVEIKWGNTTLLAVGPILFLPFCKHLSWLWRLVGCYVTSE